MAKITRRNILMACTAASVLPRSGAADVSADEFLTMDATGLAELVRKGEVSPLELVEGAIRRIEKLNPRVDAVVWERFEKARLHAIPCCRWLILKPEGTACASNGFQGSVID
jgi:hypothetical protein